VLFREWKQHVSPKRLYLPTKLHGVTTQKSITSTIFAVRTSKLIIQFLLFIKRELSPLYFIKHTMTHMPIARQQLGKHIPVATNVQATIEKLPLLCNGAVNTTIEEAVCSIIVITSDCKGVINKSNYQSKPPLISHPYTRQYFISKTIWNTKGTVDFNQMYNLCHIRIFIEWTYLKSSCTLYLKCWSGPADTYPPISSFDNPSTYIRRLIWLLNSVCSSHLTTLQRWVT
jgi:hypothetical protein